MSEVTQYRDFVRIGTHDPRVVLCAYANSLHVP